VSGGAIGLVIAAILATVVVALIISRSGGDDPEAATTSTVPDTTTTTDDVTTTEPATTTEAAAAATTTTTTTGPAPTSATGNLPLPPGPAYVGFETINDDSGLLEMNVPIEWSDRGGLPWAPDGGAVVGVTLRASTDWVGYQERWDTPGVFFGASDEFGVTPEAFLDARTWNQSCTYDGRETYDDGAYVGVFDTWIDCGGLPTDFVTIAASPPGDPGTLLYVQFLAVTDPDLDALEEIISSFRLLGPLP
jgi:hypothetical protein